MRKNQMVHLRFSTEQFKLLKQKMEVYGYMNQSQFIRDCCLRDDYSTLVMIREIYKKIMGEEVNDKDSISR